MSYLSEYLEKKNAPKINPKLVELYKELKEIIESDEIDWEEKYDLGFKVYGDLDIRISYCDPDTTYEEDIMALYRAVKEKFEEENE